MPGRYRPRDRRHAAGACRLARRRPSPCQTSRWEDIAAAFQLKDGTTSGARFARSCSAACPVETRSRIVVVHLPAPPARSHAWTARPPAPHLRLLRRAARRRRAGDRALVGEVRTQLDRRFRQLSHWGRLAERRRLLSRFAPAAHRRADLDLFGDCRGAAATTTHARRERERGAERRSAREDRYGVARNPAPDHVRIAPKSGALPGGGVSTIGS